MGGKSKAASATAAASASACAIAKRSGCCMLSFTPAVTQFNPLNFRFIVNVQKRYIFRGFMGQKYMVSLKKRGSRRAPA